MKGINIKVDRDRVTWQVRVAGWRRVNVHAKYWIADVRFPLSAETIRSTIPPCLSAMLSTSGEPSSRIH